MVICCERWKMKRIWVVLIGIFPHEKVPVSNHSNFFKKPTTNSICRDCFNPVSNIFNLYPFASVCIRLHPFVSICIHLHPFASICFNRVKHFKYFWVLLNIFETFLNTYNKFFLIDYSLLITLSNTFTFQSWMEKLTSIFSNAHEKFHSIEIWFYSLRINIRCIFWIFAGHPTYEVISFITDTIS